MKNHPLSSIPFLKPLPNLENTSFEEITQKADKSYQKEAQTTAQRKILTPLKGATLKTPLIQEIDLSKKAPLIYIKEKKTPAVNHKMEKEITLESIEQNAEKFKSDFKEITNLFKEQIKELSQDLEVSKKAVDHLLALKKKENTSFFSHLFKKKNALEETPPKETEKYHPLKDHVETPSQIINSRTLLKYASDWTRTIFSNRILFKALPGSGTILIVLPRGNIRFIQFNYKDTPIHPTQEDFKNHLAPLKVYKFNQFIDYRNWIYEEMRKI